MASKSPCARQRINLTMEDKLKVIEHHEQHGTSTRKLAVIFGCGRTQVQQILMKREEIRRFCETSQESILKKRRQAYKTKYDIISQAVYIWFLKMRLKNLPLNGPILQEKAKQVAHEIAERSNDNEQSAALRAFTASNGWLHNFKERYGLSTISFAGEPKQWSSTASGCLKEMLEDYDTNNIFNLNEAGLFWKDLPGKRLNQNGRSGGGRKAAPQITITLLVNADGEKEPAIIIGKSKSPQCFLDLPEKTRPHGIQYYSSNKALMTSEIFTIILQKFNMKMANAGRKVLLLLEKAPCHPDLELTHVKLAFLPPNITSKTTIQPLDSGVIRTFKMNYKELLLQQIVANMGTHCSIAHITTNIDLLMAVGWIKEAWNRISPVLVQKCFRYFDMIPDPPSDDRDINPFVIESESTVQLLLNQVSPKATINELFADDSCTTRDYSAENEPDEALQNFIDDYLSGTGSNESTGHVGNKDISDKGKTGRGSMLSDTRALAAINTLIQYGIENDDSMFTDLTRQLNERILQNIQSSSKQSRTDTTPAD